MGARRWIELSIRDNDTGIVVLWTHEGQEDRVDGQFNSAFACDMVEAMYRRLRERAVEVVSPSAKQPWGEFAAFKEPDGDQFMLSSRQALAARPPPACCSASPILP